MDGNAEFPAGLAQPSQVGDVIVAIAEYTSRGSRAMEAKRSGWEGDIVPMAGCPAALSGMAEGWRGGGFYS
jgi:hypothetical protein